jgi:hypothetical protein
VQSSGELQTHLLGGPDTPNSEIREAKSYLLSNFGHIGGIAANFKNAPFDEQIAEQAFRKLPPPRTKDTVHDVTFDYPKPPVRLRVEIDIEPNNWPFCPSLVLSV